MSILDWFYIVPMLFAIALFFGVGLKLQEGIQPTLNASFNASGSPIAANIINNETGMIAGLDNLYVFIVLGVGLAMVFLASQLNVPPVFYIFFVFLFMIVLGLTGAFANGFFDFAESASFNSTMSQMPATTGIWQYMPTVILVFGALSIIAMYAKLGGGQQGGASGGY